MRFGEFTERLRFIERQSSLSDDLFQLFKDVDSLEMKSAIYLCQGRLAETYRSSQVDNIRLAKQVIPKLNSQGGDEEEAHPVRGDNLESDPLYSLSNLYQLLHSFNDEIKAWLSQKQAMPHWFKNLVLQMNPEEVDYLGRIITGGLFTDEVIIAALSNFGKGLGVCKTIEKAYKFVVPDLGIVALALREKGFWAIGEIPPHPGIPLKPEEIHRWDSPKSAWHDMGACFVQPKYDGWQIQIHKNGSEIQLFDRDLNNRTLQLNDIVEICRDRIRCTSVILDSEIVGYDPNTQRILPWKQTISAKQHKVFVFDIIMLNGNAWHDRPYYKRREQIRELVGEDETQSIIAVHEKYAESYDALVLLYNQWENGQDTEGVVIKNPNGIYRPGKKNKDKGKLKPYISLDTVILGYKVSSKGVPSFLVGVWEKSKSKLAPIGWVEGAIIPSGIKQELLRRSKALLQANKPNNIIPDVVPPMWVTPEIVVEVKVERRKRSARFEYAGYELDRKKELRIREDLGVADADDILEFMRLHLPPGERDSDISLEVVIIGYKLVSENMPAFLVGIWNESRTKLIPVGGIEGNLLPQDTRQALLEKCQDIPSSGKPELIESNIIPPVWINPQIVIEVMTDGKRIRNNQYKHSGYTLSNVIGVTIQDDMDIEDASTLSEFHLLVPCDVK